MSESSSKDGVFRIPTLDSNWVQCTMPGAQQKGKQKKGASHDY